MSWIKKLTFLIIGISVTVIFSILILEIIFGTWVREDEWKKAKSINIARDIKINYDVEKIYGKNLQTVKYTRDKNGLRGSCSNPKDIDILTIGGSTTDQRYISDGETYQDELQNKLTEKFQRKICVSNAGVDGHTSFGHLEAFRIWFPLIEGLKPKYVLLYVGINDAGFRSGPNAGFDIMKENESLIINEIRSKSALYDLARNLRIGFNSLSNSRIYAGHSNSPFRDEDYIAINKTNGVIEKINENTVNFEKRFNGLLSQISSYGAAPICVSQPHRYIKTLDGLKKGVENVFKYEGITYNGLDYDESISALNESIRRLCLENSGYYFDIASKKFEEHDFYDGVHTTPLGARQLAKYIFDQFIQQKILF